MARTSSLQEVGDRDDWRCWLCDKPVDADRSVNDSRGPSVDTRITRKKAKKKSKDVVERLAHRDCNTGKGNVAPVVAWPDDLFVSDPAVLIASVERLSNKGGREAMGRCLSEEDAEKAGAWLLDRLSRLEPALDLTLSIEPGGGQYLLVVSA